MAQESAEGRPGETPRGCLGCLYLADYPQENGIMWCAHAEHHGWLLGAFPRCGGEGYVRRVTEDA